MTGIIVGIVAGVIVGWAVGGECHKRGWSTGETVVTALLAGFVIGAATAVVVG